MYNTLKSTPIALAFVAGVSLVTIYGFVVMSHTDFLSALIRAFVTAAV